MPPLAYRLGSLRRTLSLLLVGLALGVDAGQFRMARAHDAEPAGVRNVLLIVADDLKASALGCYGNRHCRTPNLDRLASSGLRFDAAYCQGTWCAPSRQSFMFSRYRGAGAVNLGQCFREAGWYSARIGKIYHMRVPGDIVAGTDGQDVASSWTERFNCPGPEALTPGEYACLSLNEFTRSLEGRQSTGMPHRMFVSVKCEGDGADQPDARAADQAISLLQTRREQPFFLAVGLIRPHYPMVAPARCFAAYPWDRMDLPESLEGDLDDIPPSGRAATQSASHPIGRYPDNQRKMWSAYYAAVTFMDEQVGRIIAEVDRLGLRDSTAIVFISDHGYHLGEHGFWQKSNLHEEVLRVPLIIDAPGMPAGATQSLAELVDLFPTLAELAGVPTPSSVQGKSLVPILRDPQAEVRTSALALHQGYGLRTRRWAYCQYDDGTEELYDMHADAGQFHNLAARSEFEPVLTEQRAELATRLTAAGFAQASERPNVIVVLTDDQGYGDLGCYGAQDMRTPRIDRLAAEGVRLTSYYAGAQVCTPSRAALLTGCYPERVGNLPVLFPHSDEGLHPDETTIAEMLRDAGYATACIGKWHLGHHPEFLPTFQGFDEYFGVPYSNDMGVDPQLPLAPDASFHEGLTVDDFRRGRTAGPPLMRGTQVVEWPIDQALLTRRYTEEAQRFIRAHAQEPFFIYLAHSMPHVPLYPSDEFSGKSASGLYGDAIEELDWSMGRILDTLAEYGVAERTLVIFTSDNGPWNFPSNATDKVQGNRNRRVGGSAGPLRGYKFSTWEGGMRVPCVVRWPQRIPAGGACDRPVSAIDLLPTVAAACGASLPIDRRIDGRDLLPLLTSAAAVEYADRAYFYRTAGVRVGSWKWHKGQLFNLASDPGETTDCRAACPEVAARLEKLLEEHRQTLKAEQRPPGFVVRPAHPLIGLDGWTVRSGRWNVRPDGSLRQGASRRPAVAESPAWNEAVADVTFEVRSTAAAGRGWNVQAVEDGGDRAIAIGYGGGPVGGLTITLPDAATQQLAKSVANESTKSWQRVRLEITAGRARVHWNDCEVHCGVLPADFRPAKVVLTTERTQADFRRLDVIDAAGGILTRLSDPASVTP